MYGRQPIAAFLYGHPRVARTAGRAVIAMELSLPLALVLPDPLALGLLGVGVLFHLSTAVVMGLNNFLLAFLAAYPSAVLVTV
jgi:hypothetical protein